MGSAPGQPSGRPRRSEGFGLVEVLVALLIVSLALLFTLSLLAQDAALTARLDAQSEALAAQEQVIEAMRAGVVPLRPELPERYAFPPSLAAKQLFLLVEVEPLATPGLIEVTVTAQYTVRDRPHRKTTQTLFWRP